MGHPAQAGGCVAFAGLLFALIRKISRWILAEELRDECIAQAFDVHCIAGGEVEQAFAQASGAVGVDASPVNLALGADERARAGGAFGGEDDRFGFARVLCIVDDGDDLGDDVAAALDLDEVADADGEARDLVGVVQRSAGDGGASDEHRSEDGDGCHLSGAADLEVHAFEARDGGARGELVGDGPARGAAGEAEAALLRGGVHFDHDAVDLVAERVSQAFGVGDEGEDFVDGADGGGVGVDAEACGAEGLESGGLRGEEGFAGSCIIPPIQQRTLDGWGTRRCGWGTQCCGWGSRIIAVEEEVGVKVEAALGYDVRLEGADGSGGGIARVGGRCETLRLALLVELAEGSVGEHDLAAHLEAGGQAGGRSFAAETLSGTERMVRTLVVTSSPMAPSPRVRPRWRRAEPSGAGA